MKGVQDYHPNTFFGIATGVQSIAYGWIQLLIGPLDTFAAVVEPAVDRGAVAHHERNQSSLLTTRASEVSHVHITSAVNQGEGGGNKETVILMTTTTMDRKYAHSDVIYHHNQGEEIQELPPPTAPRSSSLYGRTSAPADRRSSNATNSSSKSAPEYEYTRCLSIESLIGDHCVNRTNLANRYRRSDRSPYLGRPACPERFRHDRKKSSISNMLAMERGEPQEEAEVKLQELARDTNIANMDAAGSDSWIDEDEFDESTKDVSRTKVARCKQAHPVRDSTAKANQRPAVDKQVGKEIQIVKAMVAKIEVTELPGDDDECAVESYGSDEWKPCWAVARQRYNV